MPLRRFDQKGNNGDYPMRFVCLLHVDKTLIDAASPEELAQMDTQSEAFDASLMASGHYVTALALADPETAVLVRSRNGTISATDGPYAETKEHLGGLILIEAETLEEAVEIARRDPMAPYCTLEVRAERNLEWQKRQQGR